ncbi:MAG TPA: glycosyltransferase [Gaiellaceae bacterium]|nr:glycosyltransferase [Gaiellaceae bacterium]
MTRTRRVVAAVTPAPVKKARRAVVALAPLPGLMRNTRLRARFDGAADAPLVSVVIATYNWSSVLRCAIASALAQTYPAVEVVVVGDACTDDSEEVVASFGDERVRWHNLPENSGNQALPNNAGIELARGDYIAYLGHDDIWLPSHLSLVMNAVVAGGADLGYAVTQLIGPKGSGFRRWRGIGPGEWGIPPPSAFLHTKRLIDEIGPWKDYRTISAPPDLELVERARGHGATFAPSHALTVVKFPSALRQGSYLTKLSDEQETYLRRIRHERAFVAREFLGLAAALMRAEFSDPWERLPTAAPPNPVPPGWYVTQWRRTRGLEE